MSRRTLLAGVSAAAALTLVPSCQANAVVDVTEFGATGDGVTDDSAAIKAASAALRSRGTLHFPTGTYRFAQQNPRGQAAIVIGGVSDVTVEFDAGAELFMDNLDPTTQNGTSHGVLLRGPASRIALRNINIRWASGAQRSLGDGIRVEGRPVSDAVRLTRWTGGSAPVTGITLSNCVIHRSPQTGVVMLGVSDIAVAGLQVADTGADGLHFNACRRAVIDKFHAVDTGDDGLALVTYFAPQFSVDDASHTFSFPTLSDWSNAHFDIRNVSVVGGRANGIRLAGAQRVSIRGLRVDGVRSGSAVMVDSAEPGTDVGWNYVASRDIRVDDVTATNCDTGIHVLARPGSSGDQDFSDFGVHIEDANFTDCTNWSVRAESLTERKVSGLRIANCTISATSTAGGNGGVGIANAAGISMGTVMISHTEPVVTFDAVNAGQLDVNRLIVTISTPGQPSGAAAACVSLVGSHGAIDDMELQWSAAPDSWVAVRRSSDGSCGDEPLIIRSLKVTSPVSDSTVTCP